MKKILFGSMALMAFASGCGSGSNAPQPAVIGGTTGLVTSTSTSFNCANGGISFGGACAADIGTACNEVYGSIQTLNGVNVCKFNLLEQGYSNYSTTIDLYFSDSGTTYYGSAYYMGTNDPTYIGETLNLQVMANDEIQVTAASGGWNSTAYHSSAFNFSWNDNFSSNSAPSCSNTNSIAAGGSQGLYGEIVSSESQYYTPVAGAFAMDLSGGHAINYAPAAGYLRIGLNIPPQSGAVSLCSNATVNLAVWRCEDISGNTYQCE